MCDHCETKIRRHSIGNVEPVFGTVIGAVQSPMTLQEEAFDSLDAPIKRVASVEVPLPYAKPLERAALTGAKQLMEAIEELAPRRRR